MEKMLPAAHLAVAASPTNATSLTAGTAASSAACRTGHGFPSLTTRARGAGERSALPREISVPQGHAAPHGAVSQLLPAAPRGAPQHRLSACSSKPSGYQQNCQESRARSQEDGAHPKKNDSQLPLRYLRLEDLGTGLPPS